MLLSFFTLFVGLGWDKAGRGRPPPRRREIDPWE